jgi:hypothetical protein
MSAVNPSSVEMSQVALQMEQRNTAKKKLPLVRAVVCKKIEKIAVHLLLNLLENRLGFICRNN